MEGFMSGGVFQSHEGMLHTWKTFNMTIGPLQEEKEHVHVFKGHCHDKGHVRSWLNPSLNLLTNRNRNTIKSATNLPWVSLEFRVPFENILIRWLLSFVCVKRPSHDKLKYYLVGKLVLANSCWCVWTARNCASRQTRWQTVGDK